MQKVTVIHAPILPHSDPLIVNLVVDNQHNDGIYSICSPYYLFLCFTIHDYAFLFYSFSQRNFPRYHVPRSWLKPTNNLIVIFEELGGNPSKISLVKRTLHT